MLRRLYRTIMYGRILKPAYDRMSDLERQIQNRRHYAIEELLGYLVVAEVPGDYLEFGVYAGDTFAHACKRLPDYNPHMRFFAFDSFEGLPQPKNLDAVGGYTSNFHQGQFAYSEEDFKNNLRRAGVNVSKVTTVKGWFDQSLTPETAEKHGISKIAAAWIDCDLYESTVPVLKFITPYLTPGSVIVFDDWRAFRNHPDFGEQRACREWLEANPRLTLRELGSFGWHGIAFTVCSCPDRSS